MNAVMQVAIYDLLGYRTAPRRPKGALRLSYIGLQDVNFSADFGSQKPTGVYQADRSELLSVLYPTWHSRRGGRIAAGAKEWAQ
jgi:hypothetical protein